MKSYYNLICCLGNRFPLYCGRLGFFLLLLFTVSEMEMMSIIFYQAGDRKRDKGGRRGIYKKERFSLDSWIVRTVSKVIQIAFCVTICLHSVNSQLVDFQFRVIQYSFEGWWLRHLVLSHIKEKEETQERETALAELTAPPLAVELIAQALFKILRTSILPSAAVFTH